MKSWGTKAVFVNKLRNSEVAYSLVSFISNVYMKL